MEMSQVFTAMAFVLFADENVDIAVIEVKFLFPYFLQLRALYQYLFG